MHALIRRTLNSRILHLTTYHKKYSFCKIRKFSQEINTATIESEPRQKEKDKKYVYTNKPPWMIKEKDKTENAQGICERKSQLEESTVNMRGRGDRRSANWILKRDRQQGFPNKTKGYPLKKIKRKLSHSAILNDKVEGNEEEVSSTKSKYLRPVVRKIDKACNVLNRDGDVQRPILPTFKPKNKDPCGRMKKVSATCAKSADSEGSSSAMKQVQNEAKQNNDQERNAAVCFKQKETNKTESLTSVKEKQVLESADKRKTKNILQNLKIKIKETKDVNDEQVRVNAATLTEKESSKKINTNLPALPNIKINDLLKDDILWAKEKIIEMKRNEDGPAFLNQSQLSVIPMNIYENKDKESKKVEAEKPKIDKQTLSFLETKKQQKRKFTEHKDQVILKLSSNPLKLNSEEMLYAKPQVKNKTNDDVKGKTKTQSTLNAQDRDLINRRKRIKSNIKVKTKLNYPDFDSYNKKFKSISADKSGKRSTGGKINKYLRELSELSNKKRNHKSLNRLNVTTKKNPIFNSKSTKDLNKMNPSNIRKGMSSNTLGIKDAIHKSSVSQINVNRQVISTQPIWYKDNKQHKLKERAKNLLNASKKKPVFIPSNKPTLKAYPIIQGTKRASNADVIKIKPVFGPPGDNKPDEPVCIAVVNTDTCLAEEKKPVCTSDEQRQLAKKQDDSQLRLCPKDNKNLIAKLKKILDNYLKTVFDIFKKMAKTASAVEFSKRRNQPKDNLNVSVLVTQKKKQPIYICDACSYLSKHPTIYQRLSARLDHFNHLIKTEEVAPKKPTVNTMFSVPPNKSSEKNLTKQCCPNKTETSKAKVIISCNPTQSYSDVLSNLFSSRVQQRSS